MNKGLVFMGMGFELVAMVLAALYIGDLLDSRLNLGGLGVAFMVITSMAGWMFHLFVMLKRFMADDKNDPAN